MNEPTVSLCSVLNASACGGNGVLWVVDYKLQPQHAHPVPCTGRKHQPQPLQCRRHRIADRLLRLLGGLWVLQWLLCAPRQVDQWIACRSSKCGALRACGMCCQACDVLRWNVWACIANAVACSGPVGPAEMQGFVAWYPCVHHVERIYTGTKVCDSVSGCVCGRVICARTFGKCFYTCVHSIFSGLLALSFQLLLALAALEHKGRQPLGSCGIIALTTTTRHCVCMRELDRRACDECSFRSSCTYCTYHICWCTTHSPVPFSSPCSDHRLPWARHPVHGSSTQHNAYNSDNTELYTAPDVLVFHFHTLRHDFSVVKSPHVGSGAGGSGAGGSGAGGSVCTRHRVNNQGCH